jgi:long-chain fatty acid transport protein
LQGTSKVKGDDSAWSWDAGVLFTPSEHTRVGLSYRAALDYHIEGDATFTAPSPSSVGVAAIIAGARATSLADGPVTLNIKLPANARISLVQDVGDAVELLADVQWTEWSAIQELRVTRTSGVTLSLTPERWRDTWRYSAGANFKLNDAWKLRAGVAYDETPVPDETRTPRLPDGDRTWASIGAQWKFSETMRLDAAYTHLFVSDVPLDQNAGSTSAYGLLNGQQTSNINILGVQLSVDF